MTSYLPCSIRPAGRSRLASSMAAITRSNGKLRAFSFSGSSSILTSLLYPPQRSTWATPGIWAKRYRIWSSMSWVSSTGSNLLEMPRSTTGKLAISNLLTRGLTMSSGSSLISSSNWACTSRAAASISVPQTNRTRTELFPSEDCEVISSTPGTVPMISSMIWVTRRSMTSGLAPSYWVRTVRVGSSTLGSRSIFNRLNETIPSTTTMRVTMVMKMGRLTLKRGNIMGFWFP